MRKEYFVKPKEITRPPTHAGLLFAEEILPLGRRTIGEIATLLGVSRQTLHRVMAGESAITPDMAVRLGKLCGNGPDLWLRMQAAYDGWEASKRLKREIEKIPVLR
jgi:addiction module HigA family antidote